MIVLIDTNILLDVLQERKPHASSAVRVWKLVEEKALEGYVSAISFNNVFYIARKQVGSDKALEAIKLVRRTFRIVPLDDSVIDRALVTTGNDFEDALRAAAATHIAADYIVTRNPGDFASLGVSFLTAEALLAIVQP
jgi:predicted nucleic acid-binding protein